LVVGGWLLAGGASGLLLCLVVYFLSSCGWQALGQHADGRITRRKIASAGGREQSDEMEGKKAEVAM
jgi:hypothetical protein